VDKIEYRVVERGFAGWWAESGESTLVTDPWSFVFDKNIKLSTTKSDQLRFEFSKCNKRKACIFKVDPYAVLHGWLSLEIPIPSADAPR